MLKIVAIFCFLIFPLQVLAAPCSDLAAKFAKDQNSLTIEELNSLKRCVDGKVREKHGLQPPPSPAGVPGSPQQQGAKPPLNLPAPPPRPGQAQ